MSGGVCGCECLGGGGDDCVCGGGMFVRVCVYLVGVSDCVCVCWGGGVGSCPLAHPSSG